ncbi:MAG TPA: VWA domain-containing protein [Candidatus Omnitrophota bacterium]|nr:VWA domain-containing protein [Candidatus Omnitrophota bacterium]
MQFAQPAVLNLLWLMVPLFIFLWWALRRYRSVLTKFSQEHLLPEVAGQSDFRKYRLKTILIFFVFLFSILALARPQWGFEWQELKREGMDIFIVVDTSKSMLTQDVKPNRLERTKLAIADFVTRLKGDRIGLIAFAGDAFYLCPLTVDYNGFLLSFNDLDTNTVPRGGTNIEQAIEEAMKGYDDTPSEFKAIIVMTDGDNLEGDPLKKAREAKAAGIKIYTVGIGTPEGELIQVHNEKGEIEFLKDSEGNFVKSRLNERLLQQIALTTDGIYVKASGIQFGLDVIYEQELSKGAKREIESKMEKKYYERFQFPLTLVVIMLLIETLLTTRRKEKNA